MREYGLPGALYPDRHSIHRRNDKEADVIAHRTGKRPLTQFGRAMGQLNVKLICANSPQAKGRVERTNGVLQDRLVKMLKLEGITDMSRANAYLRDTFGPAYNAKFAVAPMRQDGAHRPAPSPGELDAALRCITSVRSAPTAWCRGADGACGCGRKTPGRAAA
ncbi:MAG: hypothetical protein WC058_01720 [Phycisphaeraceae bacterium]